MIHFIGKDMDLELQKQKNKEAIALLESWLADDSGYGETVWETLKKVSKRIVFQKDQIFEDATNPGDRPLEAFYSSNM